MPPADFPAAHSMDACWFAVDKDGHIGFFDTGESGAIPEAGVGGDDAYELRRRLAEILPRVDVLHDPRGRALPGEAGRARAIPDARDWPTLVFLTNLAPAQTDVEAGRATVVRATDGYAVVYPRLSADQARRLRDSGTVVSWDYYHGGEDDPPVLAAHGIYEYTHLCEDGIAGPYGRERVPALRVHIDQLPPDARKALKGAHLPALSFADLPLLQPMEHWPCGSWEPAWLGTDGVVRPVPDREEEYEQVYDEMRADFPEYRYEPPPGAED